MPLARRGATAGRGGAAPPPWAEPSGAEAAAACGRAVPALPRVRSRLPALCRGVQRLPPNEPFFIIPACSPQTTTRQHLPSHRSHSRIIHKQHHLGSALFSSRGSHPSALDGADTWSPAAETFTPTPSTPLRSQAAQYCRDTAARSLLNSSACSPLSLCERLTSDTQLQGGEQTSLAIVVSTQNYSVALQLTNIAPFLHSTQLG